jgi:hypothetical protein
MIKENYIEKKTHKSMQAMAVQKLYKIFWLIKQRNNEKLH